MKNLLQAKALRRVLVPLAATGAFAMLPSSALAGSDTIAQGTISGSNQPAGPVHSLNRLTARRDGSSGNACVTAWQPNPGYYLSGSACSATTGATAEKLLCGCVLRQGIAYAGGGSAVNGTWRQYW